MPICWNWRCRSLQSRLWLGYAPTTSPSKIMLILVGTLCHPEAGPCPSDMVHGTFCVTSRSCDSRLILPSRCLPFSNSHSLSTTITHHRFCHFRRFTGHAHDFLSLRLDHFHVSRVVAYHASVSPGILRMRQNHDPKLILTRYLMSSA